MKNFDWSQFTRKIAIQAPKQKLYDAWTKPNELERWFLSNAEFYTSEKEKINKTESIKEGQSYDWQWFLYPVTETGKVTKANGSDFLQFTFAGDCLVDVNFKTFKNGTIVSLTQKNIPTDDENKMNVRLGCDKGWSFYLVNLKSVYEGGLDLRNKNPELKPMLNN